MSPELFQLIEAFLIATIPIVIGYFANKYLKDQKNGELARLASEMLDKIVAKYLAKYPDADGLRIARLITQELVKFFNIDEEVAESMAMGAVAQYAPQEKVKSLAV